MADARLVANRFLELADADGRPLTPMQVLKLVYIAHGWSLGLSGQPLIRQPVEAWKYGPVIKDLYNSMRGFGGGAVRGPLSLGPGARMAPLTAEQAALIRRVYDLYAGMSGMQLSRITHADGTPWQLTYVPGCLDEVIDDNLIADHYKRLAHAQRSRTYA